MEKKHRVSGFCPSQNKEISVSVTYVFNFDCWEKGISELPCSNPCSDECPIVRSAPDEIENI